MCFKPTGRIVWHESSGYASGSNPQIFAQDFFGVIQHIGAGHGQHAIAYASGAVNTVFFNIQHQQGNNQYRVNHKERQRRLPHAFDEKINKAEKKR